MKTKRLCENPAEDSGQRPTPEGGGISNKDLAAPAPDQSTPIEQIPIVGIGASAGGLAAFELFFSGMPADKDLAMAFVLVQHLDPNHKSLMSELVGRMTRMKVFEVMDGVKVEPNCVYIIPPNTDMAYLNGRLHLIDFTAVRSQRLPIDFFFYSLAQNLRERAIVVVLSGTGSDGALGVRAIKAEGGLVLVEKPECSQYDGMPSNAISTGVVDFELSPAEMPAKIIAHVASHPSIYSVVAGGNTRLSKVAAAMQKAFIILRAQTGHDFSQYKPSIIQRRIERRMAAQQIKTMDSYVAYLNHTKEEVEALFRDFLIGVTSFFRDPKAFQVLGRQVIPKLLADRPAHAMIRVWVPGCCTGEEAYSIAILLQEQMETLKRGYKLQIFATDIDQRAIEVARIGIYPSSSIAKLSTVRRDRFFDKEPGSDNCRIQKNLRDLIVFSEQDVIKDPPFTKVDLISCRNLLIYLDSTLQKKLILLFHYALNPGGFLFLGTSETPGNSLNLFTTLDRKEKLYQRLEAKIKLLPPRMLFPVLKVPPREESRLVKAPPKLSPHEITEKTMLQQLVQASALVNAEGDIIYIHGRTGMYLELASGEAGIINILKTAREGLRRDLALALHKAAGTGKTVCLQGLRVKINGHFTSVKLTICPAATNPGHSLAPALYLVIFENVAKPAPELEKTAPVPATIDTQNIAALTKELRDNQDYLKSSLEELETSNEDLKSSNEEMQSLNEELQSSNEELETSKEELQSVNEELSTVNAELQYKVADLACLNNDMNNLLTGSGIATVFVDLQLVIQRFTPGAAKMINLISSDVGRPLGHLASNLINYPELLTDAKAVLNTLVPKERETRTTDGKWHLVRILPYRTLKNSIEGVVICFVDITELKLAQSSTERLAAIIESSEDCIIGKGLDGLITSWNRGAEKMFHYTANEMIGTSIIRLIPKDRQTEEQAIQEQVTGGKVFVNFETLRLTKEGRLIEVTITVSPIKNAAGQIIGVSKVVRDITASNQMKVALKERVKELAALYGLAVLAQKENLSEIEICQELAALLPKACLHAGIAGCRIVIADAEFSTPNFRDTEWKLSTPVKLDDSSAGKIEVCYLEQRPELDEGPFLKEERQLIDSLGERLGRILARKRLGKAAKNREII